MRIALAWSMSFMVCLGAARWAAAEFPPPAPGGGGLVLPRLEDYGVSAERMRPGPVNRPATAVKAKPADPDGLPLGVWMLLGTGGLAGMGAVVGGNVVLRHKRAARFKRNMFAAELTRARQSDAKPLRVVAPPPATRRAA